jgi:ribosomal protein S18 acetylase RimI-like enzyme
MSTHFISALLALPTLLAISVCAALLAGTSASTTTAAQTVLQLLLVAVPLLLVLCEPALTAFWSFPPSQLLLVLVLLVCREEDATDPVHGHITSLAVARTHRKMGIAAKLMSATRKYKLWVVM